MKNRLPHQNDKKIDEKISVRKHLPLSVRVHYDAVRNFSLGKLAGLGVMAVMAVFGVFLATQIASPQSSAAASTITLKQLETNWVEAVISGSVHPPRLVRHVVSDEPTCDNALFYENPAVSDLIKFDPYFIDEDADRGDSWGSRNHYQGDSDDDDWDDDNWITIWEADNNHKFRFIFPMLSGSSSGYIGREPVGQPVGKYLCMMVSYNDNNADLQDFKQISLLTLEEPVLEGANYKLTANQSVYWSAEKADDDAFDACEGAISTSGQTSTSFTFESTEDDHYDHFCIRARNANGIQVYKLIRIFPPKEEEEIIEETPIKDEEATASDFSVIIRQHVDADGVIQATALLFLPGDTVIASWKYAIVDADVVSINKRGDCRPFFGSGSPDGLSVNVQTMPSQETNKALAKISTQYSGDWLCVQATDQTGSVGYGYMKLIENHNEEPIPPIQEQNDDQPEQNNQNQNPDNPEDSDEKNSREDPPATTTIITNRLQTEGTSERAEDPAIISQGGTGGTAEAQDEQTEDIPDTGFLGDQNSWIRLSGYILVAAAVLGAARILIIKKYKSIDG